MAAMTVQAEKDFRVEKRALRDNIRGIDYFHSYATSYSIARSRGKQEVLVFEIAPILTRLTQATGLLTWFGNSETRLGKTSRWTPYSSGICARRWREWWLTCGPCL